jgi:lipoprotein signal peptidase
MNDQAHPPLARRIAVAGLSIVSLALAAHLLAGLVGVDRVIGAGASFAPVEHYPEPDRSPVLALLLLFALLVALLLFVTVAGRERRIAAWGASLIGIGGTINLSEEALRGSVRNYFILISPESYAGIAFNVADLALLVGLLSLALLPLLALAELARSLGRGLRRVADDEGA